MGKLFDYIFWEQKGFEYTSWNKQWYKKIVYGSTIIYETLTTFYEGKEYTRKLPCKIEDTLTIWIDLFDRKIKIINNYCTQSNEIVFIIPDNCFTQQEVFDYLDDTISNLKINW